MTETPLSYQQSSDEVLFATAAEQEQGQVKPALGLLSLIIPFSLLILYPVCFGGVHPKINLSYQLLICVALLLFLKKAPARQFLGTLFRDSAIAPLVGGLSLYLAFVALQNFIFTFSRNSHPILGESALNLSVAEFLAFGRAWVVFAASTFLWLSILRIKHLRAFLWRSLTMTGVAVAAIGLIHWFYDNGLLFWVFAPDNVFASDRARWPFVNANHFAAFLMLPLFLSLAQVSLSFGTLVSRMSGLRLKRVSDLLMVSGIQRAFFRLCLELVLMGVIALGVVAALSRASWLAVGVGLLTFMFGSWFVRKRAENSAGLTHPKIRWINEATRHHRHSSKTTIGERLIFLVKEHSHTIAKAVLVLIVATSLVFFLNEKGKELLEGRLEYALTSSLDDARWVMFQDTAKIFSANPLLGVGIGNWSRLYPSYASPTLAGLDPVYLHSDPYQVLVESGIIGFALLAWTGILFVVKAMTAFSVSSLPLEKRLQLIGIVSGLLALFTASCFDFPLRIPAINYFLSAVVASGIYLIDRNKELRS